LNIRFADDDQHRVDDLAEKCNFGLLTTAEAEEYDAYIEAADLMALWKSKSRILLKRELYLNAVGACVRTS
jgi:dsDNA-binding SOS-regulon protein